jgi:hypothetical protein
LEIDDSHGARTPAVAAARAAGAEVGIVVHPDAPASSSALEDVSFVIVEPLDGTKVPGVDTQVFAVRTLATSMRASHPALRIVIDIDAFAAAGVAADRMRPYADASLGASEPWRRASGVAPTSVDELIRLSLTSGVERIVLPLAGIPDSALLEFAARAAVPVDVTAQRRLTVGEIIARHQAERRRQADLIHSTIARGTTSVIFEVPGFVAPVNITADTTVFAKNGAPDMEHRNIRVNGAPITGGTADVEPLLPLVEAERMGTPPLAISLDDAYEYTLEGEEAFGEGRAYVVSFKPRLRRSDPSASARQATAQGASTAGRAWIDAADFSLRRLQIVQSGLRGPIVSSEQIDDFDAVPVGERWVRLPVHTRIFQIYDGVGYRTPVHRTIDLPIHEINATDFGERLAAAYASPNVMMRETAEGLRYLVRDGNGAGRRVAAAANRPIRIAVVGMLVDSNITAALPFAGLNYLDLNLFGTGMQVSAFFGGAYGEASWSLPSIGRSRWQLDGRAFGIVPRYYDRSFRQGIERYQENIEQRPAHVSASAVRPISQRLRLRAGYEFDVTSFARASTTARSFRVPATAIVHGFVGALEAQRDAWTFHAWWNPARRQGWREWGITTMADAKDPANELAGRVFQTGLDYRPRHRDFQRYGVTLSRTVSLRPALASRVETAWVSGHDLDRFSRYSFNSFDNRLHGYPTASIRYDRGVVARSVTSVGRRGLRLDGFADLALVRDVGFGTAYRGYPGTGAAVELPGPFRTLVAVEWGYGFKGLRTNARQGTQTMRITGYRMF